jgi:hypothetical protein
MNKIPCILVYGKDTCFDVLKPTIRQTIKINLTNNQFLYFKNIIWKKSKTCNIIYNRIAIVKKGEKYYEDFNNNNINKIIDKKFKNAIIKIIDSYNNHLSFKQFILIDNIEFILKIKFNYESYVSIKKFIDDNIDIYKDKLKTMKYGYNCLPQKNNYNSQHDDCIWSQEGVSFESDYF